MPAEQPPPGDQLGAGENVAAEFAVSFEDLIVNVRRNGERERVCGPITGCVRSGQVLAVVGAADKSGVVLNALRGVYNFSSSPVANSMGEGVHVGGTITWNGQKPQDVDPRVLSYLDFENADPVPEEITCWELLAFTIKVRVTFLSATEQVAMVDQVLDMLSLAEFAQTPYGHLSPAQQRLARVAREVVGCAGIVFLHDPCNGLGAMDSVVLVQTLAHLAQKHGYAVTISLPDLPPGLVSVLSQAIVLASDGRVVYQGAMQRASAWFGVQGLEQRPDFSHKTPHDLVPLYAEFSTGDLLVHGVRLLPHALLDSLVIANADSDAARAMRRAAVEVRAGRIALPALVEREGMPTTEPGDLRWIVAMLSWEWSMVRKDPLALHRYLAAPLVVGLTLGLLYSRLPGPADALGVQERLGLFSIILLIFMWDGIRRRGAMEERVMWEDVVAGRITLATHVLVVLYGEVLVKVTLPALLLALSVYLTAALELDVVKALEFVLICVLAAWSLAILPLAYQVLSVGLCEVGGVSGSGSWVSVHLPRFLSWAAGILLGALFMVGGFPLAPADVPLVLQWLRCLLPPPPPPSSPSTHLPSNPHW